MAPRADLAELLKTVQNTGRAGSLTIKLKVSPTTRNGGPVQQVTVTAERKLELPKPDSASDFFWLTDDGETTRQHPRQQSLELREVAAPGGTTSGATSIAPTPGPISHTDADGVIHFKEVK